MHSEPEGSTRLRPTPPAIGRDLAWCGSVPDAPSDDYQAWWDEDGGDGGNGAGAIDIVIRPVRIRAPRLFRDP